MKWRGIVTIPADATAETRPAHPKRQGSIDKGKLDVLEKRISERPNKEELVERNILKGG
jgi:hypothetical protein